MLKIFTLVFFILILNAHANAEDEHLKKMIGRMLVIGFEGTKLHQDSDVIKAIQNYDLGGVILFDRFYTDKTQVKNISSPKQLQNLSQSLQSFSTKPLLIAIDQEGGNVARLKPRDGFPATPSAFALSQTSLHAAKEAYTAMAKTLVNAGINCDFGPVVDLAINPKNSVIVGLQRSYGSTSDVVSAYAKTFIAALKDQGIISVAKHFPGHGSSLDDSHLGFVDISHTWSEKELEPYARLIQDGCLDMIMSAHVFNTSLDKDYPATLSYAINTTLLRTKMGFRGVLISDDLQMKAISEHYNLKETLTLAINSGIDILLFGNQLSHTNTDEIVETIFAQVKNGAIPLDRIKMANERIKTLHVKENRCNQIP